MRLFRRRKRIIHEIAPDEIFLDSSNLPDHNTIQFEGRVARPVSVHSILGVGLVFLCVISFFSYRAFSLEILHGEKYADISENNTLDKDIIFATRGVIFDRTGRQIAWNEAQIPTLSDALATSTAPGSLYALRAYTSQNGLSHLLGFLRYPKADAKGEWWREEYSGVSGVELSFEGLLHGKNGNSMVERDALGTVLRQNIVAPPVDGQDLTLAIDATVQSKLFEVLSVHANRNRFQGGAAVIMDVRTGEVLAITSFPEYDSQAYTDGDSVHVAAMAKDPRTPLLNRAVAGLYTPGSIVKPIFAIAALNENIISPDKQIQSVGQLTLPNPFDPSKPSIFRDWTVHGWVDMRTAIAVSSDEYFYVIGGGFQGQKGLGIAKIDEYSRRFGLASLTGIDLIGEKGGIIPTPEWKEEIFGADDPWRIGNTYHTAIGQFGFQITPLEAVRFTAAIANGGKLLKPQLIASSSPEYTDVGISDDYLQIAREGMRLAVVSPRTDATVKSLYLGGIEIAAKTGTAQLGSRNQYMNSWSVGFWPASDPKYAYAVVLEHAPAGTMSGAAPGLQPFFQWLISEKPEYVK